MVPTNRGVCVNLCVSVLFCALGLREASTYQGKQVGRPEPEKNGKEFMRTSYINFTLFHSVIPRVFQAASECAVSFMNGIHS